MVERRRTPTVIRQIVRRVAHIESNLPDRWWHEMRLVAVGAVWMFLLMPLPHALGEIVSHDCGFFRETEITLLPLAQSEWFLTQAMCGCSWYCLAMHLQTPYSTPQISQSAGPLLMLQPPGNVVKPSASIVYIPSDPSHSISRISGTLLLPQLVRTMTQMIVPAPITAVCQQPTTAISGLSLLASFLGGVRIGIGAFPTTLMFVRSNVWHTHGISTPNRISFSS